MPAGLYIMTVNKVGCISPRWQRSVSRVATRYARRTNSNQRARCSAPSKSRARAAHPGRWGIRRTERRAFGRGKRFRRQEEIERRNSQSPTELFRTFASIDVVAPPGRSASAPEYLAVSKRATGGLGTHQQQKPCYMTVVVDEASRCRLHSILEQLPPPKRP